ncbi:DedA family protein [Candidatus Micrarchaeota archaeon]|nr:DedA family protein [Candidatus Micrarchaeota archaeon]
MSSKGAPQAGKRVPGKGRSLAKRLLRPALLAFAALLAALAAVKAVEMLFPGLVPLVRGVVGDYGLFGTFIVVLLGSTLVPFTVDLFFVSVVTVFADPVALIAVSVAAAVLGGVVNYALAFMLSRRWIEGKLGREVFGEAREWFDAYGGWAIMLFGILPNSPIIDPLTFVAGLGKMDFRKFTIFTIAARTIHFALLAALALGAVRL